MYFISATCFDLKVGHHQALQIVSKVAGHNLTAQPNFSTETSPSTGSDLLEPHLRKKHNESPTSLSLTLGLYYLLYCLYKPYF